MAEDNVKAQMRKGILEYCILAILSRGDSYAPRIIAELKAAEMIVVEGTLYPILTRQKNAGLLTYRWEESPQGPPRKYYTLTEKGREALRTLDQAWIEMVQQIDVIRHGGKQAIALQYDDAYDFDEQNKALVVLGDRSFYIDLEGNELFEADEMKVAR